MNYTIGASVMLLGVALIGSNLYNLYHGLPFSPLAIGAGTICALMGGKWLEGKRSTLN